MDHVDQLVVRLNSTRKLRVWSLIITFFGDAVVPRGGSVSARTVQVLLGRMGIEAGAVRTAFSRLTNDGWVVREKLGRSSFYHLSPTGLEPFAAATDRIYAPLSIASQSTKGWRVSFQQQDYPKPRLMRLETEFTEKQQTSDQDFLLDGQITNIPDWMKDISCPADHKHSFTTLMEAFGPVMGAQLTDIDALAVRCLLIHEWRRILFQFHNVAPEFWTPDWPEAECHRFVSILYHQLLASSEAWMDQQASGLNGALPQSQPALAQRFT